MGRTLLCPLKRRTRVTHIIIKFVGRPPENIHTVVHHRCRRYVLLLAVHDHWNNATRAETEVATVFAYRSAHWMLYMQVCTIIAAVCLCLVYFLTSGHEIEYATRNVMRHGPVTSTVQAVGGNAMDTLRLSRGQKRGILQVVAASPTRTSQGSQNVKDLVLRSHMGLRPMAMADSGKAGVSTDECFILDSLPLSRHA